MCGRLMSPAHETQSMWEIRLLRGRLPRKGGGLTGMHTLMKISQLLTFNGTSFPVMTIVGYLVGHQCNSIEHILSQENEMSLMGFDPSTSYTVRKHSTN